MREAFLVEDTVYPYSGTSVSTHGNSCKYDAVSSTYVKLASYIRSTSMDVDTVKRLVATQPITAGIAAS